MKRLDRAPWCLLLLLLLGCLWPTSSRAAGPAPVLVPQTGHSKHVKAIVFSADGRRLVTASSDGTARRWDLETGKEMVAFLGHTDAINSVTLSQDEALLITGSEDRTVRGWEVATGKLLWKVEGFGKEGVVGGVLGVALSPDGTRFVATNQEEVYLYETATQRKLRTFTGHTDDVRTVAFLPDGKQLLTGGDEGKVRLWDVETGSLVHTFEGQGSSASIGLTVAADGRTFAVRWSRVHLFSLTERKELRTIPASLFAIAFSGDATRVATADFGKTTVWDATTGQALGEVPVDRSGAVAFSPDGRRLVVGADRGVRMFELDSLRELPGFRGRTLGLLSVAVTPDGKTLATGGTDKFVRLWDLQTGRMTRVYDDHKEWIFQVAFSADGRLLASTGSYDHTIKVREVATGRVVATLVQPERIDNAGRFWGICVTGLALSPDGKKLVTVDADKSVRLWQIDSGKQLWAKVSHKESPMAIAFSPDGQQFVTGDRGGVVRRWWADGSERGDGSKVAEGSIRALAFSPDGARLAVGGEDRQLRILDANSLRQVAAGPQQGGDVRGAAFSADSQLLLSGSEDGAVLLLDRKTGEVRATLSHGAAVKSVAFLRDGRAVVAGEWGTSVWDVAGQRQVVRLMAIDRDEFLALAPDSYYSGSRGGSQGLAFRVGDQVYPFEQFDLRYNRPDLILQRLGAPANLVGSYRQSYLKRLKKMGFTEELLTGDPHAPTLTLAEPPPLTTATRTLAFQVKAGDTQVPLDRLQLFQNDVPVFGTAGIDLRRPPSKTLERTIELQLAAGRNKIQVSVLNAQGVESLRQTFETTYTGPTEKPDLYVVAIGVSRYTNREYDLGFAAKDAGDLATFFEGQAPRFGKVKVLRLLDQDATRAKILAARDLLKQTKVDDEVVLFVAGHGLLDTKLDYYLATTDIDFRNPAKKGLAYQDLESLVDGIPALRKLVLIDTCHSGEVDRDDPAFLAESSSSAGTVRARAVKRGLQVTGQAKKGEAPPAPALGLAASSDLQAGLFADLRRGSGAMVISSAGGAEYALESASWNNGVFTYAVLEGLKSGGADRNRDGQILVSELRDHVVAKVRELTQGRQTPTARQENLESDFPVF